jgi:hypothetical protein
MINFHRGATASEASGVRHAIVNGVLTRATRFRVRRAAFVRDTNDTINDIVPFRPRRYSFA